MKFSELQIRRYTAYNNQGTPKDYFKLVKMFKHKWMGGYVLRKLRWLKLDVYARTTWEEVIFDDLKDAYTASQNLPKDLKFKFTRQFSLDFSESIPVDNMVSTHGEHLI